MIFKFMKYRTMRVRTHFLNIFYCWYVYCGCNAGYLGETVKQSTTTIGKLLKNYRNHLDILKIMQIESSCVIQIALELEMLNTEF